MEQPTILVIEDELELLGTIQLLLELHNFKVLPAETAGEGIHILQHEHVDLVLSDVSLPDETGYSILHFVRNHSATSGLPFLLMSAFADENNNNRAITGGADGFFSKPFSTAELLKSIAAKLLASQPKAVSPNKASRPVARAQHTGFADLLAELLAFVEQPKTGEEDLFRNRLMLLGKSGLDILRDVKNLLVYRAIAQRGELPTWTTQGAMFLSDILTEVADRYLEYYGDDALALQVEFVPISIGNAEYYRLLFTELIDHAIKFNSAPNRPPIATLSNMDDGFEFTILGIVAAGTYESVDDMTSVSLLAPPNVAGGYGLGLFNCKHLCKALHLRFQFVYDGPEAYFTVSSGG